MKSSEYFQTDDAVARFEAKETAPLLTNELLKELSEQMAQSDTIAKRRHYQIMVISIATLIAGMIAAVCSVINLF